MLQTSTHEQYTVGCSLSRIKDALAPSTPCNIYLVLDSLIQQILIMHLYVQADTSLSSQSLCCRSLDQDSALTFPKLAVISSLSAP